MPASQTLTRVRAETRGIKLPILISFIFMPLYMCAAMTSISTSRDRVRQFTVIIEASNFQMFLFIHDLVSTRDLSVDSNT